MNLIESNNPILHTPCDEFDFASPPFEPIEFAKELVAYMYKKEGLGLAANQVGVPYRIFAMRGEPENFVMFNPRIVAFSDEEDYIIEGCLTYPNLYVKIKRPIHVRVRFTLPNGETRTQQFTGATARTIQHEIDHLNGEVFYNKASRYHRDMALRKWRNRK